MAEERFELVSCHQNRAVCVISLFVLLPVEADPVPKKRCGKRNLGRPHNSNGSKVVLTLLTEVVAVHVGLSAVYVRGTAFNFSRSTSETTETETGAEAGAGTGAKAGA